jgi:hypothetical protein
MRKIFSRLSLLWITLYFILLALVFTFPLVLHMGDSLAGKIGDNVYFVWMIGWFKKALFDLHVNPFNIWFLNYPQGWNLAYTEITPIMLGIALPFSFINGPVLAYNIAMLATFVISGLGMFLWVKHLTGRMDAALVAGTIYSFLPYHFAHFLIGHLNLAGIQWFPFYFMGLFELLGVQTKVKKPVTWWKAALLGGISLGLIAMTSQYFIYMTLLISAFILLCYLIFLERSKIKNWHFWRGLLVMGVISIPLVLVGVTPYISLLQQGGLPDRDLEITRQFSASASPTDFILPSTDHFLWGEWINTHFNRELWAECTLYMGAAAGALALWALLIRKQTGFSALLVLLFLGGLAAFILALGPDFLWFNERVTVVTPTFLTGILHRAEFHIPLPGYFLFKYFPLFAKLRAFARFGVFLLVFESAAAGLGAMLILNRFKTRFQPLAAAALIGFVLLDFYPGPLSEVSQVEARPVDYWLTEQPGQGAVIQMPFVKGEDQEQIYYTLINEKPFVGGFFNAFPPEQYQRITPIMAEFPDQASISEMRSLGVEYVLVDTREYADINQVIQECQLYGLKKVQESGDQIVFEWNQ